MQNDQSLSLDISILDHEYAETRVGIQQTVGIHQPDHDYCSMLIRKERKKAVKSVLQHRLKTHISTVELLKDPPLSPDLNISFYEQVKLKRTMERTRNIKEIVTSFMASPDIRLAIVDDLSVSMGKVPSTMRNKKHGFVSILMKKDPTSLQAADLGLVVQEMKDNFPDLLQILHQIMVPANKWGDDETTANLIPKLALVYGIIMQSRCHELSMIQRMVAMTLADNICDQSVSYFFFLSVQIKVLY